MKRWWKMTWNVLLAAVIAFGMVPSAAFAEEKQPNEVADQIVLDGITYYNVKSQHMDSKKQLLFDMLTTKSDKLGGKSLLGLWRLVTWALYYKGYICNSPGLGGAYDPGMLKNVKYCLLNNVTYNTSSLYVYIKDPSWSTDDGGTILQEFYVANKEASAPLGLGKGWGMFSIKIKDFSLVPIVPGTSVEGNYVEETYKAPTTNWQRDEALSSINASGADRGTVTKTFTETNTVAITNSTTHTTDYSFKEGIKFGGGFEADIFKLGLEVSTEFQQGWSDSITKGTTATVSKSNTSSVTCPLPPWSVALVERGLTTGEQTLKYNCPLALSFKVVTDYRYEIASIKNSEYTFGGKERAHAADDLKQRALLDVDHDDQGIGWRNICSDNDYKDAISKIASYVPMSGIGMKLRQVLNSVAYRIGTVPYYPLYLTRLEKPDIPFMIGGEVSYQRLKYLQADMKIGDYSNTAYLKVQGYNNRYSPYYGFMQAKGKWIVVDKNGKDITGSAAAPVELSDTPAGQIYTAVRPGTCYLKYLIDEHTYTSYINPTKFTTNADLISSAALRINVSKSGQNAAAGKAPNAAAITYAEADEQDPTHSDGVGGGSIPYSASAPTSEPISAPTSESTSAPAESVQQPTTAEPVITQDAFTGVSEEIETSADGAAVVTSVTGIGDKTLRITGTVSQNGTNYAVTSFAAKSFSGVGVKNITIDLKVSGNTQTVTFMPETFKGSDAKKLTLRLSSSGQVKFRSGAMSGSKIKKVVVSGLNKKEFKRIQKKLMKSGYTGEIVKK